MDDSFNDSELDGLVESDSFQSGRVAELQGDIKACKRSSSSNEDEILGRLQETDSLNKNSQLSMTEQDGNEDEILNDIPDSPTKDIGLFSDKNASLSLEVPLKETKPLKKRIIVSPSNSTTAAKKVCLNRTKTVTIPESPAPVAVPESTHKKITMTPVTTDSKEEDASKKSSLTSTMTTQEKLALRAQRFNISDSGTTKLKVVNKGTTPVTAKSDLIIGSGSKVVPDMDVLKKRAERFGVSVSTVMKQIEEKEKVLKRQLRFGASAALSKSSLGNETQQKKLRAQRFGLS